MVETRGSRRFAILFFVLAFALLFAGRWLQPVDSLAVTVTAPFQAVLTAVLSPAADFVSGVTEGQHWHEQNLALQKQVAILLRQNLVMQDRLREDAMLRRMVRFTDENNRLDLVTARVIGGDPNLSLAPYVIINHGSRDGIRQGMTVVDPGGNFVGSITGVTINAARVQLMTSPSSSVGAIDSKTQATGVVEGQYNGPPQLRWVVTSSALHVGDFVTTSGQCDLFPRLLILGQIARVQHSDVSEFQTADLQPATDFGHLDLVEVVRNFVPSNPCSELSPGR